MGDKVLETRPNDAKESTYSVVLFKGGHIPKNYINKIYSQWKKSLRHGNHWFELIDQEIYYSVYGKYIESILERPSLTLRLALLPDMDTILGWSAIEDSTLHYVHVDYEQRGRGIGRSLVPCPIHSFTHLTKQGIGLWNNKAPKAKLNPFL